MAESIGLWAAQDGALVRINPGDVDQKRRSRIGLSRTQTYCGVVVSVAARADHFKPERAHALLSEVPLTSEARLRHASDDDLAEYLIGVQWWKTVSEADGLRISQPIRGAVRKMYTSALANLLRETFGPIARTLGLASLSGCL